jgi:fibronectin type 3 domain-containing protein
MSRRALVAVLVSTLALTLASCGKDSKSITSPVVDLSPPQAPSNLQAVSDAAAQRDYLTWDLSASASVTVYMQGTTSNNQVLVASVDANTAEFILPLCTNASTEMFRVRAIGTNAVPSAFSNTVAINRTLWDVPVTTGGGDGMGFDNGN